MLVTKEKNTYVLVSVCDRVTFSIVAAVPQLEERVMNHLIFYLFTSSQSQTSDHVPDSPP